MEEESSLTPRQASERAALADAVFADSEVYLRSDSALPDRSTCGRNSKNQTMTTTIQIHYKSASYGRECFRHGERPSPMAVRCPSRGTFRTALPPRRDSFRRIVEPDAVALVEGAFHERELSRLVRKGGRGPHGHRHASVIFRNLSTYKPINGATTRRSGVSSDLDLTC